MKTSKFNGKVKEINEEHMCFKQKTDHVEIFHSNYGFTGYIKEVFDIEGRLVEYERKDADGHLTLFESNNYDLNGNLLSRKSMDEGYNKRIKQNIYNFNNKLIQTKGYNGEGSLLYTTDYFYYTNNKLEKSVTKYEDTIVTELFKYDSEERLIESTSSEKNFNYDTEILQNKVEYEYSSTEVIRKSYSPRRYGDPLTIDEIEIIDLNDRLIEHKYYIDNLRDYDNVNEKFHCDEKFFYDDKNLLIQKITLNDELKMSVLSNIYEDENLIEQRQCDNYRDTKIDFEQTKYSYKFDEKGNWIERYTFFDRTTLNSNSISDGSYSKRIITYY